jgi:NAD(P)-dependent dehydrogenase (short-subunit alcohol dehydrogenase family)
MKLTKDLVIFITGGASGLGEATVREVHAAGCKVGVADLNQEALDNLKNELGGRIFTTKCDVSKEEDVKRAIDETVKAFGTIHVALACAGVAAFTPTLTVTG